MQVLVFGLVVVGKYIMYLFWSSQLEFPIIKLIGFLFRIFWKATDIYDHQISIWYIFLFINQWNQKFLDPGELIYIWGSFCLIIYLEKFSNVKGIFTQ